MYNNMCVHIFIRIRRVLIGETRGEEIALQDGKINIELLRINNVMIFDVAIKVYISQLLRPAAILSNFVKFI